jgi:hypothetical protein
MALCLIDNFFSEDILLGLDTFPLLHTNRMGFGLIKSPFLTYLSIFSSNQKEELFVTSKRDVYDRGGAMSATIETHCDVCGSDHNQEKCLELSCDCCEH